MDNKVFTDDKVLKEIQYELSSTFEKIFDVYSDCPEIRLIICQYTMGYMGASYGLHIPHKNN